MYIRLYATSPTFNSARTNKWRNCGPEPRTSLSRGILLNSKCTSLRLTWWLHCILVPSTTHIYDSSLLKSMTWARMGIVMSPRPSNYASPHILMSTRAHRLDGAGGATRVVSLRTRRLCSLGWFSSHRLSRRRIDVRRHLVALAICGCEVQVVGPLAAEVEQVAHGEQRRQRRCAVDAP